MSGRGRGRGDHSRGRGRGRGRGSGKDENEKRPGRAQQEWYGVEHLAGSVGWSVGRGRGGLLAESREMGNINFIGHRAHAIQKIPV